jgi:hypothetical protein
MVSSYLNFFEILKFRQVAGRGIGVFVKNSIFQKCPNMILPKYDELLNIIYNISLWEAVKFPIFGDSLISKKYWKNEFFLEKGSRFASYGRFSCAPHKYKR